MTARRATVAVVDDDLSVRRGVARLLRSAGYEVATFSSADEFLARDGSPAPACLIVDLTMPGTGGLRLREELIAAGQDFPVIFITGLGDTAAAGRAMRAGAHDFLTKPFEDERLLAAVARATASDLLGPSA